MTKKMLSSSMAFEFACDFVNNDLNYLHLESTSCPRDQFQCKNRKCISKTIYAIGGMTVETIVMKPFVVCLINSLLFIRCLF